MAAADILRIATTVGTVQLLCDLISNWRIYRKEPYQRALGALSRQKWKRDKALADSKEAGVVVKKDSKEASGGGKKGNSKVDKHAKRLQRVEDDYLEAASEVARRHTLPGVLISVLFLILMRILGAEYTGQMIGILPFAPFSFLQRFFGRGLEFGDLAFESMSDKVTETSQACSFVFVYMLATMSIKYYVGKLFGTQPPAGAEGMMAILDSPAGQKLMKSVGVDPEEFKELRAG